MPSTSAAYLIIVLVVFAAFASLWDAGADTTERVSEAIEDQREQTDRLLDTRIEIRSASYNGVRLAVTVENTGSTRLALAHTDILIDGRYHQSEDLIQNTDATGATVLHIGETAEFALAVDDPGIVSVVTEQGIADTVRVETFLRRNDVTYTVPSSSEVRSARDNADVETGYTGTGVVIGPVVENFVQTDRKELPAVDSSGALTIHVADGSQTQLTTNAKTNPSRLTAGTWQGSQPSIFYANASKELRRVTSDGTSVAVPFTNTGNNDVEIQAVSGIADIDGDGAEELVFGGNSPSGNSDSINYIDDDGTVAETNGAYGTSSGIGLGEPADFDGDGVARVPYVDGSNNIKIVSATGTPTAITSTGPAAKSPMASVDADGDGESEIVFLNQSASLNYVDNVTTDNRVRVLTNSSGASITGQEATGAT